MLNKQIINEITGATIYTRGFELFRQNKVLTFQSKEQDEEIIMKAVVQGSGKKKYKVELVYNTFYEELSECFCDCPAFYNYDGICKHCAAVLLECENRLDVQQSIFDYIEEPGSVGQKRRLSGYIAPKDGRFLPKSRSKETTPVIKDLLRRQRVKSTLPLMQDTPYEKISLEPHFKCSENSAAVEFKIGMDTRYVLKNVFEFAENIESCAEYSYGKKLKFVHTISAFEPLSQKIVKFILDWIWENGSRYIEYDYYSYTPTLPKLRQLPLNGTDLEELLSILKDSPVLIDVNGLGENIWYQTDRRLIRRMRITGKREGIEVKSESLTAFFSTHFVFTLQDGLIYRESRETLSPIQDFLSCLPELPGTTFYVDRSDIPMFCRELLPLLEKHYECERVNFSEADYGVEPVSFEIYLDAPQKDFITCKVYAIYGERKFEVYKKDEERTGRDAVKEIQVGNTVASYCNAYDEKEYAMVIAGDEDKIYDLLTAGIPRLQALGDVYVSDALKKIRVVYSGKVEVGVSLSEDLLELTMHTTELSKEELIEILSKYDKKKKYFRLKSGSFIQTEDEGIQTLLNLRNNLNLTDIQLRQETVTLPKYRALYLDNELQEAQDVSTLRNEAFQELVRNMKTADENDFEAPASLESTLRPYQIAGFTWLKTLYHNGFGGILADDMGLGKTLQTIAFLLSEYLEAKFTDNRRVLIVTPASLVFNWKNEFSLFAPSLPVKMVTGSADERREFIRGAQSRDILVTSYELLKRDLDAYEGIPFFCQIIDEAQYIKNHNTQAAKAVKAIESKCRFALTGTPIENRLSELWSIFDYLMPGLLYRYQRFRTEIEIPVVQNQDEAAMNKLQKMVRPFILRRLKKDVLTDLPDKLEKCMYANMEGEQQKLYYAHVQRIRMMLDKQSDEEFKTAKIQILSELTKLRQLCCDPALIYEKYDSPSAKSAMCIDLIKNAVSGGHKVLLFSQFTSMLENLQVKLREEGISYYVLTGATPKEQRLNLVESFNRDETNVFCISLKAGGTGLNLTSADIVIHFDPWWNLAVQNQATDRAHRIGQTNVVNVYKLIMKDTIEENIMKLQERKKELAEQVLSGEDLGTGILTKEELLELLAE
ncbi:MAG: SNF2 helicase associated domain-containing protein [Lachnospiraceae bacterium]|nr:SNF2 helicase associated domain-containing protein [Lachnospiraceae bacterium]